jgi:ferredoxin-NADP reductase
VPCLKLEMKMDLPGFSRQFLTSGRLGFCFRVLEEGEVGAGDAIELVESGPENITVWDFARLYFFDHHNLAMIRRLIRIPSVPPDWVRVFEDILASAGEKGQRRKPQQSAWKGFRPFIVDKKVPESQTITSFYLVPEDGQPLPFYMPGQFLTFRLPIPDRPKPIIRTYSLSECPCHAEYYRVTIKKEPSRQGSDLISGSNYFHDVVEPGDRLQVAAPRGDFFLDPQDETPVVLLSGGVGLTPMISMLNAIADSGQKRPAWFIHGTRSGIHHAMCKHMRQVAAENDNITVHIRYSQPRPEDIEGREYDSIGHVDIALLESLLPGKDMDFYLCGPPPFMNDLLKGLWNWGIPEPRIRLELFGPAALLQEGTSARRRKTERAADEKAYEIRFSESGITAQWDPEYENLLELAEDHGVFPEFSCRSGICHSCQYKILKGDTSYNFEPLDPPDPDQVLLCCARPKSDMEIEV